jgi:Glycosyl hydrolase family 10
MGVIRFRLTPPDLANRFPDLRKAYMTGLDRTPGRMSVEVRVPGLLVCHREFPESGRLHIPWPVEGYGAPIVGTATLAERDEPYELAVELARGKLNEVRNQAADWKQVGLQATPAIELALHEAQKAFAHAATAQADPVDAAAAAQRSLTASHSAAEQLIVAYTDQVLNSRLGFSEKLPTWLACGLEGHPKRATWSAQLLEAVNAARIGCTWARFAVEQGQYQWDLFDAQLAWCRRRRLTTIGGPLLEFRASALPDWLWLWEGDFEAIQGLVTDLVRQIVSRYRGKVPIWNVVHRAASGDILGLSEEEQVRLTAQAIQVARQADAQAQLIVEFDRPWAEWMGTSPFQFGPLHLADELARADLGLAGIGLEIAPGFSGTGSHIRDLLDFSRLLDLYALLNLPIHVSLVIPSSAEPDLRAEEATKVEVDQWPRPPDEQLQAEWAARWVALAVAKPFVRSVTWLQACDANPHLYPYGGLFRADETPKPVFERLKAFRSTYLE